MAESRKKKPDTPSFEDNLKRLEEIVERLELESVDLDESLRLFEEGIAVLRDASSALTVAETRVRQLVETADGTLELRELDA
ncbi:MAG: exodeoxyribonuclease VII small subunit [Gemmatimonadaceae bacterium]|nr:exodeoxyribonuclease VII small subunit [Gemmatimonadaceae bacterium]